MAEKSDRLLMGKIFGILSIVFAFVSSWGIGGIILGIIGLVQLKDEKKQASKKPRQLNILGIVFGSIIFIIYLIALILMVISGELNLFPVT